MPWLKWSRGSGEGGEIQAVCLLLTLFTDTSPYMTSIAKKSSGRTLSNFWVGAVCIRSINYCPYTYSNRPSTKTCFSIEGYFNLFCAKNRGPCAKTQKTFGRTRGTWEGLGREDEEREMVTVDERRTGKSEKCSRERILKYEAWFENMFNSGFWSKSEEVRVQLEYSLCHVNNIK
ncbi:MAG: hypothetical protein ACRC28_19095 [Clostridium sp.]|uniref:hypothetical protein n=1 Tax=Clostridium sp. TaxID=1506 RepID=UPI003F3051C5